jgi:hypothetical protein
LSGGKSHYFIIVIVPEKSIEVVKIAPRGTHDDYFLPCHKSDFKIPEKLTVSL